MDQNEISKLVLFIEENLRSSQNSGVSFVDPRKLRQQLKNKQNHIIFGRRGAGKSTLIFSLKDDDSIIPIFLNMEDYKDISFPNIILQVLISSLTVISKEIRRTWFFRKPLVKSIKLRSNLSQIIKQIIAIQNNRTDEENISLITKRNQTGGIDGSISVPNLQIANANIKKTLSTEVEQSKTVSYLKIDEIRKNIPIYKNLFEQTSLVFGNKPIFLILDDFYFIHKSIQPDLIDFFHRLTKGTSLYLKVATIRHRSQLYKRDSGSYSGVEIGHDIFQIDMDYNLEKFDDLKSFMQDLLEKAKEKSKSNLEIESLFAGEGFNQLCLASGGVPRDFLSLFVILSNSIILDQNRLIGKVDVSEAAIRNVQNKMEMLKIDTLNESDILEKCLDYIKNEVYERKRTNVFLLLKEEHDRYSDAKQIIRELVDLRLLHLIDDNTSCAPSDGKRYEAYMLDIGLFENSRPREFNQIVPGIKDSKSRKDTIRAAPRISIQRLAEILSGSV